MDVDESIGNGVRLLQAAEQETNLALMERLNALADSWLYMAALLVERERAG